VRTESLDHLEEETDIEGLRSSAKTVYSIIEDEIRAGIPSNKIIIGGFSQGIRRFFLQLRVRFFVTGIGSGSTYMFT